MTMDEIWEATHESNASQIFSKPTFPTRRWGDVYTKISTTNKTVINCLIHNMKVNGKQVRKRLDREAMNKWTRYGNFYKIEIKR